MGYVLFRNRPIHHRCGRFVERPIAILTFPFEYRKLGDFTYHVLNDRGDIKSYLMRWIMREWEHDHKQAPDEHWTVDWMTALPGMEFALKILPLDEVCPNSDLMSGEEFQRGLKERTDEREESILRGISIEPLLINRDGFELMDGYTRYMVFKRLRQKEIYAYLGTGHV